MKKKGQKRVFKREWKELRWRNFFFLTAAGMINAFGVSLFLFPVKLYDSGISGLSMLLDQLTPSAFTLSMFLIVLNFPIFIFGLKKQGLDFTVSSSLHWREPTCFCARCSEGSSRASEAA